MSSCDDLVQFMSQNFLHYGSLVKFCMCRYNFVLVDQIELLNKSAASHILGTVSPKQFLNCQTPHQNERPTDHFGCGVTLKSKSPPTTVNFYCWKWILGHILRPFYSSDMVSILKQ